MNKPLRVAIAGALGRMGRMLVECVSARPESFVLSGALERAGLPQLGRDLGASFGAGHLGVTLSSSPAVAFENAQVYIDFTSAEASLKALAVAADKGVAAVIGSTGLSDEDEKALAEAAKKIPVLWAPNMSVGVNVMYKMAAKMAELLGPDFDLEIVEAHHNLKKDAPSGTAVRLHKILSETRGLDPEESLVTGRVGLTGARGKNEIGVFAVRGGDIVGEHTVYFCGRGERLELTHRAGSRLTFAQGALRAAAWLPGQNPGLYGMDDVLGF